MNAEYEIKVKELQDEAQKWKFEAEAGKNFTAQLVEKVKVLEKYEEEVKSFSTMSKDYEKMECKMELLKGKHMFSLLAIIVVVYSIFFHCWTCTKSNAFIRPLLHYW